MKRIIILLSILISLKVFSQEDSSKYTWYKFQYGIRVPRVWTDSIFHLPVTISTPQKEGALYYRSSDSSVRVWTGTQWIGLGGSVTSVFGRTGAVTAQSGDYSAYYVPLARTINGLDLSANQTFATGTTGTNFTISSSGSTHTFNIPTASASNRGLLSTTDWTNFNTAFGWGNHAGAGYELLSNKSTSTSLGTSNTLYPSQNAVKTYVDNSIAGISTPTLNDVLIAGNTSGESIYANTFGVLHSGELPVLLAYDGTTDPTGNISLRAVGGYRGSIIPGSLSAMRTYTLPNKSGTFAMLDDIAGSSTNIANTSLTADGNYTQDWNGKQLKFHSVSEFDINPNIASSVTHFRLSDDKFGGYYIKANYNATNNAYIGVTAANGNSSSWLQATSGSKFSSVTNTPDSIEIAPDVAGKLTIKNLPNKTPVSTDSLLIVDATGKTWKVAADAVGGNPLVTTSSSTSLTLTNTGGKIKTYVFTGASDATWTLPAVGTTGQIIKIKTRGSGALTIQRAGSNQIYMDSAVTSFILLDGDAIELQDDGTYWITL